MRTIRGTLNGQQKTGFFSFQDIIMAVTGILIVVALILALQIDKVAELSKAGKISSDSESPLVSKDLLEDLENEVASLTENLDQIRSAKRKTASQAELKNYIKRMEDSVYRLNAKVGGMSVEEVDPDQLENIKKKAVEILRLQQGIASAETEIEKIRKEDVVSAQELRNLERKVKEFEAQAIAARAKGKRSIRLIRELSDTTKEPIIVDVSANIINLMRFDDPNVIQLKTLNQFYKAIEKFKKQDQYFVLYFRPDGSERFNEVRQAVKNSGFEVGYDAISQGAILSLGEEAE